MISDGWHAYCKKGLESILGKSFEEQQSGIRYESLRNFKKRTGFDKKIGDRLTELSLDNPTSSDTVVEQENKRTSYRSRKR